ncbi:MAG: M24 family metallopeptidase [Candidatus Hodarchaeota archaeon]
MQVSAQRLESIRRIMIREGIDVLFSMKAENVFYLTGLSLPILHSLAIIAPVDNEATLIAPSRMLGLADEASKIKDVRPYFPDTKQSERDQKRPNFLDAIRTVIEEKELDKTIIGLEYENISLSMFNGLKDGLPDAGFKDTSPLIWEMRMIKEEPELKTMSKTIEIAEIGMRTAIEIIQPGIEELEVALELQNTMAKAGASRNLCSGSVTSGFRAGSPYVATDTRKIEKDEFVAVNVCIMFDNYCGQVARTIFTGTPRKECRRLFNASKTILNATLKEATPGATASEVAIAVRKRVSKSGYIDYHNHPIGYGIGLDLREPPTIALNDNTLLRPGMVLHVYSNIYIPEVWGIRIGGQILVGEEESQIMEKLPFEMI